MSASCRPAIAEDRAFVVSTWSSSYRLSQHAGLLGMAGYADVMHREVARILDHPSTLTLVAEEPGEVDHEGRPFLYGFLSVRRPDSEMPYVYYAYVKTAYRRGKARHGLGRGVASLLFAAAGIDPRKPFAYACATKFSETLEREIPRAEFNPLPARYLS